MEENRIFQNVEHTREWYQRNYNALLKLFEGQGCANCGSTDCLQIHHIVPLAVGGTNNPRNLTLLCAECHSKAHAEHGGGMSKAVLSVSKRVPKDELLRLIHEGYSREEIANALGISYLTLLKYLKLYGILNEKPKHGRKRYSAYKFIEYIRDEMNPGEKVKAKYVYAEILGISDKAFKKILDKPEVKAAMEEYGVEKQGHSIIKRERNLAAS